MLALWHASALVHALHFCENFSKYRCTACMHFRMHCMLAAPTALMHLDACTFDCTACMLLEMHMQVQCIGAASIGKCMHCSALVQQVQLACISSAVHASALMHFQTQVQCIQMHASRCTWMHCSCKCMHVAY